METKMVTIPFDVERAKKIQAGEEPGKIVTREGCDVRIVCWDVKGNDFPIVAALTSLEDKNNESVLVFKEDGRSCHHENFKEDGFDLLIQVPEWTQFKDGDILACEIHNGPNDYFKWFTILREKIETMGDAIRFTGYVSYDYDFPGCETRLEYDDNVDFSGSVRFATDEEKQGFIVALKASTDPRAKEYLKRFFGIEEEEKPECEFEPKDWVLGRMVSKTWCLCQFSHKETLFDGKVWYVAIGGIGYSQCIPYNKQTKHLLGTTDNWEE